MGRPRRGVDILARLQFVEETGSTNADLLADPAARHGDWLIAQRQTAGRGRQSRKWQSLDGNFFGSVLVVLEETDPPATLLSLAAGLSVIEALAATPPHYTADLKWPNDVMLDDAKLGGILLERQGARVVIGFGINRAVAPHIPGRKTAAFHPPIKAAEFAPILACDFGNQFRRWRSTASHDWLIRSWEARATQRGTPLKVHDGRGNLLTGTFAGLEADGALRLQLTSGEVEIVRAGDVEL